MLYTAARVIFVEYLQNFPILLGLMAALYTPNWPGRLLWVASGAVGTAITIALTERVKLREHAPRQPTPLQVNAFVFFAGSTVYLVYFHLLREAVSVSLFADILLGLLLGLAMGVAQGYGRGVGRLNTGDLTHAVGLMGAGVVLCVVIGAVAESWSPLIAAVALCIPMTLIIVRLDYWPLIASRRLEH